MLLEYLLMRVASFTGRRQTARSYSTGDTAPAVTTAGISWSTQNLQGARRLLFSPIRAGTVQGDPGLPSNSSAVCIDARTGLVVSCQQQPSTTILIVGITCMLCLITIALFLLACSCYKRRRGNTRPNASTGHSQSADATAAAAAATQLPDSSETVIMVRVAGDEEARFVARPAPLKTETTIPDSEFAPLPTEEEHKAEAVSNLVESAATVPVVENQPWNSDQNNFPAHENALVVESRECSEPTCNESQLNTASS